MFVSAQRANHSRTSVFLRGLSLPAALASGLLVTTLPATADIAVRFVESAPKDRFVIENVSTCSQGALDITIDLGTAPVGLIFDTTAAGAGVEVFQPFEVAVGAKILSSAILPTDGDEALNLSLTGLASGQSFVFTVDVDDTGAQSELGQIRVSDAEIAGASVSINGQAALFDGNATAILPVTCLS